MMRAIYLIQGCSIHNLLKSPPTVTTTGSMKNYVCLECLILTPLLPPVEAQRYNFSWKFVPRMVVEAVFLLRSGVLQAEHPLL
jgi:hypothetical protein